jgi:hypothetical protein
LILLHFSLATNAILLIHFRSEMGVAHRAGVRVPSTSV